MPTVNLGRNVDLREALSQVAIDGENQGVAMGTPKCGHADDRTLSFQRPTTDATECPYRSGSPSEEMSDSARRG